MNAGSDSVDGYPCGRARDVHICGCCSILGIYSFLSLHIVRSEAVKLNLVFLDEADLLEEGFDFFSLVALKLDHLPVLGMLHYRAITRKVLFAGLDDFLEVVFGVDALDSGECFAAVTLLNPYVYVSVLATRNIVVLSERIASLKILDLSVGHTNS